MFKNRMMHFLLPEQMRRLLVALITAGLIGGTGTVSAWDDDDYGDDYDDYDDYGDDYDLDMGDTVIIDDSVNIYDGGGRGGRGSRGRRGGGGDAAGAAVLGFLGGLVVNEMSQPKRQSAPQQRQAAPASGQAAPTLEQQLAELDSLKARGILTEAEYNAKRQSLINAY